MVSRKTTQKWNTIRVRESTFKRIEILLNTPKLKKSGTTNISQFVTNVITNKLDELEGKKPSYNEMVNEINELHQHIERLNELNDKTLAQYRLHDEARDYINSIENLDIEDVEKQELIKLFKKSGLTQR